jgi:Right handed beta helix region
MKSNYLFTKKNAVTFFSLFVFLFCCAFNSLATTYYISPSGNDATGTGTINNPWKTLKKATATVNTSGDIIHVNSGTYTEIQQCILAVGVSIEGEGITSIIKSTYVADFEGILKLFSPIGTNGNQHISFIKFDGSNRLNKRGIDVEGRSNVSINNITMVDFDDDGIIFNGNNSYTSAEPTIYATGNKFYNNIVTNCAKYNGTGNGCLQLGGQEGMLIYNNIITQNSRPSGQNGWPIKYYAEGWLKGCKIYNNTLTKRPYQNDGWDFCLELFNVTGLEIYENTFQGSLDFNYQGNRGIYPYSLYIHDNIFTQPVLSNYVESGIVLEWDVDGCIIEDNTFTNLAVGVTFYNRPNNLLKDVTIQRNLFANFGNPVTSSSYFLGGLGGGSTSYRIENWKIYNNTFVGNTTTQPAGGLNFGEITSGYIKNIDVRNNTFQNIITACLRIGGSVTADNIKFTHNNILNCDQYNVNNNLPWFNGSGGTPTNYIQSNNTHVNPMFVGNGSYALQIGSPLIDAGTNIGLPYTGLAPDRGYAEATIALPIKLLDFNVIENSGKNILQWKTATESNSDYFNVERSSNGQSFGVIGRVSATGFSTNDITYNFTDASPLTGINYYRLSMVDKDNSSEYSKIVSTSAKKYQSLSIATAQLSAGKNNIVATVASTKNQKATFILFDATGRVLITEGIALQKGLTTLSKNTGTIPGGIYYLKIFTTDENAVKNIFSTN